jgi:hypothetical protein
MPTQYAKFTMKRCPMYDDNCVAAVINHAQSLLPAGYDVAGEIEQACGRYTRGRHTGKLRGWANITICREGGWFHSGPGYMNGYVIYPGRVVGVQITDFLGKEMFIAGTINL